MYHTAQKPYTRPFFWRTHLTFTSWSSRNRRLQPRMLGTREMSSLPILEAEVSITAPKPGRLQGRAPTRGSREGFFWPLLPPGAAGHQPSQKAPPRCVPRTDRPRSPLGPARNPGTIQEKLLPQDPSLDPLCKGFIPSEATLRVSDYLRGHHSASKTTSCGIDFLCGRVKPCFPFTPMPGFLVGACRHPSAGAVGHEAVPSRPVGVGSLLQAKTGQEGLVQAVSRCSFFHESFGSCLFISA